MTNPVQASTQLARKILDGGGASSDLQLREYLFGPTISDPAQIRKVDFRSVDPSIMKQFRTGDRWVHKNQKSHQYPDYRDGRNYLFLNMRNLREIVKTFNNQALTGKQVPLILAFFTGGTLAMVRGEDGILRPAKDGSQLLEFAGHGLQNRANLGIVKTPQIDSADMKCMLISEIVGAYHYIMRELSPEARRLFAGVVIGHGTDTAAATGALIRVMHTAHNTSVGLVAAQNASDAPLPDGPSNIAATICSLLEMHRLNTAHLFIQGGGGFSGQLLGMGWFNKVSDKSKMIFGSRGYPILCDLREHDLEEAIYQGIENRRADTGRAPVMLDGFNPVRFISLHQNDDPVKLIKDIQQSDMPFYVITSFGAGTAPRDIIRAILFADVVLQEKAKKNGGNRQQIFVNTLFADADLQHSYESNQLLRDSGIPVLCATEELINAKSMLAKALTPDPHMQKRFIVTRVNDDYPVHYEEYVRTQHPELWLTPTEIENLRNESQLLIVSKR